jgi:hypothetical protein
MQFDNRIKEVEIVEVVIKRDEILIQNDFKMY